MTTGATTARLQNIRAGSQSRPEEPRWTPRRAAITRSTRAGSATPGILGRGRAEAIDWYEQPKTVFDPDAGVYGRWFVGGVCNTCWNAVDRHVSPAAATSRRSSTTRRSPAPSRRSPMRSCRPRPRCSPASSKKISASARATASSSTCRWCRRRWSAMLACARIGAIHSVVFGGFAPKELATRIDDAKPKVILSASCGIEVARVVAYKPLLDEAIDLATHKPEACLILQRPQLQARLSPGRDHDWQTTGTRRWSGEERARARAAARHRSALHPLHVRHDRHAQGRGARQRRPHGRAEMVDAEPLRRRAGRDRVGGSDIGWVVGHSYIVYAPLLHGCTTILYEGKPVGTPDAGAFWRVIAEHGASPCSPRRPRSAPSRRKTRRASCSRNTTCRNSARCSSPASGPIPTPSHGRSGF